MTSITLRFRAAANAETPGMLVYQVSSGRRVKSMPSGYRIMPSDWNSDTGWFAFPVGKARPKELDETICIVKAEMERLRALACDLEESAPGFPPALLISEFTAYRERFSVTGFFRSCIDSLRERGSVRTSETYATTLNSFLRFRNGLDMPLYCLTPELMERYEARMRQSGLTPNTTSFYMRVMRAAYNKAVSAGMGVDRRPFCNVYTGVAKTVKRALPVDVVGRLRRLDLSGAPRLAFARDMFMMSFYLRGMSFVDMAYLRKEDLNGGMVTYCRRKTGRRMTVRWEPQMQDILDRYPENGSGYLLPVIRREDVNGRCAYRYRSNMVNGALREIGRMLGLEKPLTMYVARHSWATAARDNGEAMSVISEGMGHDTETTTRIYLSSIDTSRVDEANRRIIASI